MKKKRVDRLPVDINTKIDTDPKIAKYLHGHVPQEQQSKTKHVKHVFIMHQVASKWLN